MGFYWSYSVTRSYALLAQDGIILFQRVYKMISFRSIHVQTCMVDACQLQCSLQF